MKILLLADDLALPHDNGGKVELVGMIDSLRLIASRLMVCFTHHATVTAVDIERNRELADVVTFDARTSFTRATARRPQLPYQFSSRRLSDSTLAEARRFGPSVVVASHEWTLGPAAQVARAGRHPVPLVLRSHNNERKFMESLARSAPPIRAAYSWLEVLRLGNLKPWFDYVDAVAVIADEDRDAYRWLTVPVRRVRPSLGATAPIAAAERSVSSPSIVFAGSLDMGHTRKGLHWFVREVLPLVALETPGVKFQIIGRRCPPRDALLFGRAPHVEFVGEVDDVRPAVADAAVFVNPVFAGSGVNLKVGLPARLGVPVVSTSFGLRGLPELAEALGTFDDAAGFARRCVDLLVDPPTALATSARAVAAADAYSAREVAADFQAVFNAAATR